MVYCEIDNLVSGKSEPPTTSAIEQQRRQQLEMVLHIRRLLEQANRQSAQKAA